MYDPCDVFGTIFGSLIVLLAVVGIFGITQDHRVSRYYVGESESSHDRGYVVMAERNWLADDIAYVTDDIYKAIDVTNKLNESIGVK